LTAAERIHELCVEGLKNTAIAEILNAEGFCTNRQKSWDAGAVANKINYDKRKALAPLEPATMCDSPQDILRRDPDNLAALLDLADRERYWRTRQYRPQSVRAIYARYREAGV